jgi:hypothetical protein
MVNKFLILCSRLNLSSEVLSQMESLLESDLNWTELVEKSNEEGVGPLLYRNLRAFKERIPDASKVELRDMYNKNTARNMYLFQKVKPLLQAINDSELKVAVTKGARLAETLYPDIGLRPFVDIDLVVHPSAWPELEEILEKLGFSREEDYGLILNQKKKEFHWTSALIFGKGRLTVEVHFHYLGLQLPLVLENDLWESAQNISVGNSPAKVLSPEYELCYLCLHALQHSYYRLIWLTDIAEMLQKQDLNWEKILDICQKESIAAPLSYGLHLVNCLWPGTLSENILEMFKISAFERKLLRFFWPEEDVLTRNLSLRFPYDTPTLFSLLRRKKPLLALRTLFKIFFPPRAWVSYYYKIPVNSSRIFLHYLWRLTRPISLFFRQLFPH